MELGQYGKIDYKDGELALEAKVGEVSVKVAAPVGKIVVPVLKEKRAKFESGEIDLIKGTDLDKQAALMIIDAMIKELDK